MEVLSPSNTLAGSQAKLEQRLTDGVQLGFLLADQPKTVYIYRPGWPVEIIRGFDNELSDEPVLPGFQLNPRELRVEGQATAGTAAHQPAPAP